MSNVETTTQEVTENTAPATSQDEQTQQENPTTENPETPDAPEKSKRQMSFTVLEDGNIQATFGEGIEPLVLDPASIPEQIQAAAVTEGLISRARGYTSKLLGDERTPENLRAAIAKAFENLKAGQWKVEREPGSGIPTYTIEVESAWLFRKMRHEAAQVKAVKEDPAHTVVEFAESLEETSAMWEKLTKEQQEQVKKLPRYQQARAEITARRSAERALALAKKAEKEEANSPI